jgi:hypothetical protein
LPSIAWPALVWVTVAEENEPPCEPVTEFEAPLWLRTTVLLVADWVELA